MSKGSVTAEHLAALAQASGCVIWHTDAMGAMHGDMPAWHTLTGQGTADSEGMGYLAAMQLQDSQQLRDIWRATPPPRTPQSLTLHVRHVDGTFRPLHTTLVPLYTADDLLQGWVCSSIAVGAGHAVNDAPVATMSSVLVEAAQSNQLVTTIESIADGVIVYDRTGKVLHINAAGREMLGYDAAPPSSLATDTPAQRAARYRLRDISGHELTPAEYPITRILQGAVLKGDPSNDMILNKLTGGEIILRISGMPTHDAAGMVDGAVVVYHDVTAQRQDEQTLRESEQRLRHIFDQAPIGILCTALDGKFLSINKQFCDMLGYTREELSEATMQGLSHPDDVERSFAGMRQAAAGITPGLIMEKRYIHKDGHVVWVFINSSVIRDEDGNALYLLTIVEDLTARRAQEAQQRALADIETRLTLFQRIIDQLPNASYLVRGVDARLVLANAATAVVWNGTWEPGVPLAEFLAKAGSNPYWPDGRALEYDELIAVQVIVTGTAISQQEQVIRHANGTQLPVIINAVPFDGMLLGWRDAHGQPEIGALVTMQDVTALQEAERVKSEFLALAAHELRTPIGVVSGYAQMLEVLLPEANEEQREILSAIQTASGRLAQLANDLLDVTRLEAGHLPIQLERLDLTALARRVVGRLQVTAPGHTLRVRAPKGALPVFGDAQRLEQVITNMLTNAVKYSPAGGEIIITMMGSLRRGEAVLAVRDHGIGIPQAEQVRIFGRFARAENAQAQGIMGTGLGLYLCRELMVRQGGRIWFTSAPENGTTFFITLPLAVAPVAYEPVSAGAGTR